MKKTVDEKLLKNQQQQLEIAREDRERLRKHIVGIADQRAGERLTDPGLDKKNLKDLLVKYKEMNPVRKFIQDAVRTWGIKYELVYYEQMYRLHGWPTDGRKLYDRPGVCGKKTDQLIYFRFPQEVLRELRIRNPVGPNGRRKLKYFQLLTDVGYELHTQFVKDAIRIMTQAKDWTGAIRLMSKEFGKPYQMDIFND